MAVAIAHLVHGYLGAGKTTLARRIEAETGAVRFSADEWYMRLYVSGLTTPHLDADAWNRLLSVLDELWPALLRRDVDVVLDFGFWSRAERDDARRMAEAAGATVRLYQVVCDDNVAQARCLARNDHPDGSFRIDPAAFEELKSKFEPLGEDEPREVVETSGWTADLL